VHVIITEFVAILSKNIAHNLLQLQYLTVLDIVNNLLLYVEPGKKVRTLT